MKTAPRFMIWLCICGVQASLVSLGTGARAQTITQQQLASLVPDEQDIQGFVRLRPVGELPPKGTFQNGQWVEQQSPSVTVDDDVQLDMDASKWVYGCANLQGEVGRVSHLVRNLYSTDGVYHVEIHFSLCPSPAVAKDELTAIRGGSSGSFETGNFANTVIIGDESWTLLGHNFKYLIFRAGNLVVDISGSPSDSALRQGLSASFPPSAVEAIAYQTLMRASRQAKVTGVSAHNARMAVNGKSLFNQAFTVNQQVFVPVAEFARAVGMQSRWNVQTGALMLSGAGHQSVALTAGSTTATVGTKVAALQTPVLKKNGQPVMALHDLAALLGGRVVKRGNTFQVTV